MAACPCWGDRGIAQEPNLTEDTCVKQGTAVEKPVAAPTTMNCGGSGSCGQSSFCSAVAALTDIGEPN